MGAKDITEKILADFNDVFADIINGVLFDGKQVVSEHALENVKDRSQYKFNNKIHEQERDLAKRWIPYKICFALYRLEHETGAEPYMPMRIIGYDGAAYRGQLTKRERDRPNFPVITIVLYFGTKHWDQPRTLYECMNIQENLKPFVSYYKINVVEVAFLDDKLDNFHSDFRIIAEYFVNKRRNIEYTPSAQEIQHVDEFLKLLQALTGDDRYFDVLNLLQKEAKKEGVNMCEILDKVENRGIAIGEIRGREKMADEINQLNAILLKQNRMDDLRRTLTDQNYQRQLMTEFGIGTPDRPN
ncbi:MAG: Rpn family recombination-promoting nuclease/putative transposase [Lachnospiraceae bacterium]|nr:Rpn family recombination-promoting nuclease/putative transposase [Lachnospiraceae bacterium]